MIRKFKHVAIMNNSKSFVSLFAIALLILISCNRSEFATTVRHQKNGKTTYSKRYYKDPVTLRSSKKIRNQEKKVGEQTQKKESEPFAALKAKKRDITKVESIPSSQSEEILFASADPDPILADLPKTGVKSLPEVHYSKRNKIYLPDTIRGNLPKHDYSYRGGADTRKTEKLGLAGFILTLIGWAIAFGLPLSILGVIFGSISLSKIRRNPQRFKGRGFAITSLILGIIGIAIIIVALAVL